MEGVNVWVVLLVCAIFLTALPTLSHANPEVDALIAFKAGLHDPQNALQSWDPNSADPCFWSHIICNDKKNVVSLNPADSGLSGPLAPQLANLASLQYLILYRNNLFGPIPKQLGNLKQLAVLDMFNNNLSGPIPSELTFLPNLRYLNLSNNRLTGRIPTGGSFSRFPANSFHGNPGLCGEVIHKRC